MFRFFPETLSSYKKEGVISAIGPQSGSRLAQSIGGVVSCSMQAHVVPWAHKRSEEEEGGTKKNETRLGSCPYMAPYLVSIV